MDQIVLKNVDTVAGKVLADEIVCGQELAIAKEWNINGETVTICVEKK